MIQIAISILLFALSGFLKGISDTLWFHYKTSIFSDKNEKFWNPQISWKNKYKNGDPDQGARFPGSTTVFVMFTDAWHLFDNFRTFSTATALCFLASPFVNISGNQFVAWLVIWVVLVFVIHSGAFHLAYTVLFKKKRTNT